MDEKLERYFGLFLSSATYLILFRFLLDASIQLINSFLTTVELGYYLVRKGDYFFNEVVNFLASLLGLIFLSFLIYYFSKLMLKILRDLQDLQEYNLKLMKVCKKHPNRALLQSEDYLKCIECINI